MLYFLVIQDAYKMNNLYGALNIKFQSYITLFTNIPPYIILQKYKMRKPKSLAQSQPRSSEKKPIQPAQIVLSNLI